jgi:hypothetical protein
MVTKKDYDELLDYVSRLGFTVKLGLPGWIPAAQERMCGVADAILEANGGEWPVRVHYHRARKWFSVYRADGDVSWVDAGRM